MLALESLGGVLGETVSQEVRRECGRPITETELAERHRRNERALKKLRLTAIVMLPILVPVYFLWGIWTVIAAPFRIWRTLRAMRTLRAGT